MPASTSSHRLYLKKPETKDLERISVWSGSKDFQEFVSDRARNNYHLFYLVCLKKEDKPVGVIYTFSYSRTDGHLFLNVFLDKEYRKLGYGAEACGLAISHIFDSVAIYKIYCDAFSTNNASISMMENIGLVREGFLKGHRMFDGRRYDVIRFAIYKENLERVDSFLSKLSKRRR